MSAFLSIVGVTFRQLAGWKKTAGFGLLSLVPSLFLVLGTSTQSLDELNNHVAGTMVAPFFAVVLPIIAHDVAVAALGDERKDATLSFLVLRPISRVSIVTAKTLAASSVSFGFAMIGAVGLTTAHVLAGGSAAVLPALLLGSAIACVGYCAPFVLLGYAVSRPTLVGLVILLLFDNRLAAALPRIAPLSPWRIGFAATLDALPDGFPILAVQGAIGDLTPGVGPAMVRTAVIAVVAIGFCALLLRRNDNV